MGLRCSVLRCSALLASITTLIAPFASGCRKGAPVDMRDAASTVDASLVDAASENDAAAAIPIAQPASTATELAALLPPTTPTAPFTGTYRCFGGLKLEQAGQIVTATIHKGTTDTVIACTAGNDTCTGSVREIQTVRGKSPKVTHLRPVTLTLTKNGDVVYVASASETKPGRGEQTFCPRR